MPRKKRSDDIELPFTWSKKDPGVTVVNIPFNKNKNWKQSFLLCSDRHWDNPHSDRKMQEDHLNEALERKAGIIENGDMFCGMQSRFDKRGSKSSIRHEHLDDCYLDRLVETCADWWSPWRKLLVLCGEGNHEVSLRQKTESCLISRFCGLMNANGGHVVFGGYGGYIRFRFSQSLTSGVRGKGSSVVMRYAHGFGGGGPVTADMTQSYRMQNYLPDADIIWTGHVHEQWSRWIQRLRLSAQDKVYQDEVLHLKTATYKEEYGVGDGGWHVTTGKPPKPLGAYWLHFKWSGRHDRIVFDVERAA